MSRHLDRRGFLKCGGATVAFLAVGGCATFRGVNSREKPFFFIHVADPQLFWGPLEMWQKTIARVAKLKPAFVIVGGDLINNDGKSENHDFSKDTKATEAYLKVAGSLDPQIPLYNVAGNHDVCNIPTHDTLEWYERHFGPLWYSFRHNHALFIVLESDVLKNPQGAPGVSEKQLTWLNETLQRADRSDVRHRIVFMHHPMCLGDVSEKSAYFNMPSDLRAELLGLFHRHNVTAVFSGHYHRNAHVTDKGLELVTTSSCGKALGKDPLGFRIVKVLADRIEHEYFGFDEMPSSVLIQDSPTVASRGDIPMAAPQRARSAHEDGP